LQKNALRLFDTKINKHETEKHTSTFRKVYDAIEERQRPLLSLPEPTRHEDSAFGQLILMGIGSGDEESTRRSSSDKDLFVVHRLDCEVNAFGFLLWYS
jgi:hypothetical protein